MQLYRYTCRNILNTIKTNDTVLRKIYLSLYLKGLCVRGSCRRSRTVTCWPPHSYGHNRVSFPFSWAAQPGAWGPSLLGHVLIPASSLQLVWSPTHLISNCSIGDPKGLFCWVLFFLQFTGHLLPVNQFVTVPWDFNTVPYCQPSSPTPTEYTTSVVFGMACLAGSEVNIQHLEQRHHTNNILNFGINKN